MLLLAAGLTLRGLIPAGYMPAAGNDDGGALVLCQGIAAGTPLNPPDDDFPDVRSTRCPFGLVAVDVTAALPSRALAPIMLAPRAYAGAPVTAPARARPLLVRGPRGPPVRV